jgi:hypothetical protein
MAVIYDIQSEYWRSIYRALFNKNAAMINNYDINRHQLELMLLENDGIKILTDNDGRWLAVQIESQEVAMQLHLMYAE